MKLPYHSALLLLLFLPFRVFSTNYYISNNGNDQQAGTSPAAAWKTIDRLNQAARLFRAGDCILFQRGQRFHGTIRILASGSKDHPIVFGAYGSGNKPIITGLTNAEGWTLHANGIWVSSTPQAVPALNMVCLNGTPQPIGRYPNSNAPDGGYLRYEEAASNLSITDKDFPSSINWTSAEIVIRKNHWTAERCLINKQDGKTFYYTYANSGINPMDEPYLFPGLKNFGYFIQNDLRTLDQPGEWFYDSVAQKLYMHFGNGQPGRVQYSSHDTLVNAGSRTGLVFRDLHFEGANRSGLFNRDGGNISILNCSFNNIGAKAIHCWNTSNVLIDSIDTYFILSNAIQVRNRQSDNVTIRNCTIRQTGPYIGMGSYFDSRDYKGIAVQVQRNVVIENNWVDSSGLTGIEFQGSNATIQHNLITHFCYVLDDGAGIYTYVDASPENPGTTYINRTIRNNIILHGTGASQGSIYKPKAEGIYLDAGTMNMNVINNTVAHLSYRGIACNNPKDILIRGNTFFNTGFGWGIGRPHPWRLFGNVEMKDNIFFPLNDQQQLALFSYAALDNPEKLTIWEAMQSAGDIDSNRYAPLHPFAFSYNFSETEKKAFVYPSPLTFEQWKAFSGQDAHSVRPIQPLPPFLVKRELGNNLLPGGNFEENISSVKITGKNVEASHDQSNQLSGKGSLRIACTKAESNRFIEIACNAGSIRKNSHYRLRFRSSGNSDCGIIRAYLRGNKAPYPVMSNSNTVPFSSVAQQHELLFEAATAGDCSVVIEVGKSACITYLDDLELKEVEAVVNSPAKRVRLEYNASNSKKSIALTEKYITMNGDPAGSEITIPPFSSVLLLPVTAN